ncbi:hypothetical protein Q9L58_003400 [Maublancomyces gigas]|uniref:Transcription factor CBF/NF-Y/archaeal histone domain-containing protein n=1 Tax=Discina gigas TaxID=1032678 RepID=A0ABR3GQ08_9PEZI
MASQKAYPRSVMKRIVKAHSDRALSKNVDVLIYLDYALFLQELLRESAIQAQAQLAADGPSTSTKNKKPSIAARDVRKVAKVRRVAYITVNFAS